jgi:hypothetical protein
MDSLHRSKHLWCLKRCKEASIDSLHRSKHLWCLKRCKEAKPSIWAQLASYLTFYLTKGEIEAKPFLLMLVYPFGAKGLASKR